MLQEKITTESEKINSAGAQINVALDDSFEHIVPHYSETIESIDSSNKESFFAYVWRTVGELRYAKFALVSFVVNNLRRRYQRSILGFAWSLLNPLLMMIVLTTVFSLIFGRDPKTYGVFIFAGMLPWTFMSESIASGCSSITAAENFMKKVYIPKIFFPLVTVATECINFVLSLVSMMFLGIFMGVQWHWTLLLLPIAMFITFLFTFGVSLTMAVTTVYFRDLAHLTRVVLSCFFYLTPIVYPLSVVPANRKIFFASNPFTFFVNLYRDIICNGTVPPIETWLVTLGVSFLALAIGFIVLRKTEKDIIFRL
jgi:ABC-type polysaccharide/polyol phosphate export permease